MDFYKRYYGQLLNFHIHAVTFEKDEYSDVPFPVLHIRNADGDELRLVVSSDEEGNSAGFLFIEEDE